jgi:hypothetical protein
LDDHACVALERVDDDRVLLRILHPKAGEVEPAARRRGQPLAQPLRLTQHLLALGIVRDG